MGNRSVFAFSLAVLSAIGYGQAKPDEPIKPVPISGRVIFPGGGVESGFHVQIVRIEPGGPVSQPAMLIDSRGVFTFSGFRGATYRISLGPQVKTPAKMIRITSDKDVDVGDMVFEKCPDIRGPYAKPPTSPPSLIGNLEQEQIVIEPQQVSVGEWTGLAELRKPRSNGFGTNGSVEFPQCWSGPSLTRREEWEGLCEVSFSQFMSPEEFVGGKVKEIHVVRYDPGLTPDQIKAEVRKVWLGIFQYATCQIEWDEGTLWNVLATVEYEDGRKSSILTDGLHGQVQDREGKYWYMREWPAVD
jgi:hypothetical protein